MQKLIGKSAEYIQAWEYTGKEPTGYVYDQKIAVDKLAEGYDIEIVTIVRHNNGDREYLKGTVAQDVFNYRETQQSE